MSDNNFSAHKNHRNFIAAIEHTAYQTGFQPNLIEKDYFCSMILNYLQNQSIDSLVFKGGTLLAKAYAGFYRLSEDLDFTLPISPNAKRKQRSNRAKPYKSIVNTIPEHFQEFTLVNALTGSNESRQYNAEVRYTSLVDDEEGRILIEISLREELVAAPTRANLHSVLLSPFTNKPMLAPIKFQSLSKLEAYAEKIRAALARNRLAIRDFYDIYFALKKNLINLEDANLIGYVSQKLSTAGELPIIFDSGVQEALERKVDKELIPTLKHQEIGSFDLSDILDQLEAFCKKLSYSV